MVKGVLRRFLENVHVLSLNLLECVDLIVCKFDGEISPVDLVQDLLDDSDSLR